MTAQAPIGFSGRCIAPPVTDKHVKDAWPALAASLPSHIRSDYEKLLVVVRRHKEGEDVTDALPSRNQRDIAGIKFDSLRPPERDAAFHLLWYVNELAVGRNPST